MDEELSNAILAHDLASYALSSYVDRLIQIERSGVAVHSALYEKCLECVETEQITLAALKGVLRHHKAARDQHYEQ